MKMTTNPTTHYMNNTSKNVLISPISEVQYSLPLVISFIHQSFRFNKGGKPYNRLSDRFRT